MFWTDKLTERQMKKPKVLSDSLFTLRMVIKLEASRR